MQVYEFTDYKKYLRQACQARKAAEADFSYARLAAHVKVQRSYLSHVLNGAAHLNADQLYEAGHLLSLDNDGLDYLLLLLEIERCSVASRRRRLEARRAAVQAAKLRSEAYLERHPVTPEPAHLAEYYCDPYAPVVHMYLTIPQYLANPARIGERLGLTRERLTAVLAVLERSRILELKETSGYKLKNTAMHLPDASFLAKVHGSTMRLKGLEARQQAASPTDYFFTASFSATEAVKSAIRTQFMAFLKETTRQVDAAPAEAVYHVNFDLFQV